jgi:hypothetical protein
LKKKTCTRVELGCKPEIGWFKYSDGTKKMRVFFGGKFRGGETRVFSSDALAAAAEADPDQGEP